MEKNWLIRTHQKKILGPVSKEKIRELVEKKSLHPEDELCSGNGHWFYLREKDFLEEYVLGDIPARFNPVSEAKIVLSGKEDFYKEKFFHDLETHSLTKKVEKKEASHADLTLFKDISSLKKELKEDATLLPANEDLEYPDLNHLPSSKEEPPAHPTLSVGGKAPLVPKAQIQAPEDEEKIQLPKEGDLEYPESPAVEAPTSMKIKAMELPKKTVTTPILKTPQKMTSIALPDIRTSTPPKRNDRILILIFVFIFVGVFYLFYEYKKTIRSTVSHKKTKTVGSTFSQQEESPSPLLPKETQGESP